MKQCVDCGNKFPLSVVIDGKTRNLCNRTRCLECLPFGTSRYRKKSPEEKRTYDAQKSREWYHRQKAKLGKCPIHIRRERNRGYILSLVGGKCQIDGYSRCNRNLTFHHMHNKKFRLSSREFQFSLRKLLPELRKCIVVCHNCHGEIHDGLIAEDRIKEASVRFLSALDTITAKTWDDIKAPVA
jgi:hypothetical protein